jgi:ribosome modulation factor
MVNKSPKIPVETTEGWNAYFDGLKIDDCPYPIGNFNRQNWMEGWLNARTYKKYELRQRVSF